MRDKNELTKRLLAEGYTKDRHPAFVKGYNDFYGGFEFKRSHSAEMNFETPCGLLVKGRYCFDGLSWFGTEYRFENYNPLFHCPKQCVSCKMRPYPFSEREDSCICVAHETDRIYEFKDSVEDIGKQHDEMVRQKQEEYIERHKGKACPLQMRWDITKQRWETRINMDVCCQSCPRTECLLFGDMGKDKGNIYCDIEIEGRDYTKDGTFFEGERYRRKVKDIQYFGKPVNLKKAEIYLKANRKHIEWLLETNKMSKILDVWTMHKARTGMIDLTWKFTNFRVVKKVVRDLDQDLEDIANGIQVTHQIDEAKMVKAQKSRKRQEAAEKKAAALEKKVLKHGIAGLDAFERKKVYKTIGEERVLELERQRSEKEPEAVQMSIFDLMGGLE